MDDLLALKIHCEDAKRRRGLPHDAALLATPEAPAAISAMTQLAEQPATATRAALPPHYSLKGANRVRELLYHDKHSAHLGAAMWSLCPMLGECESIAESAFLCGWITVDDPAQVRLASDSITLIFGDEELTLRSQVPIGRYRVDFVLEAKGVAGRRVAIEIDGFAFHERTQAQASADRERDRELLGMGVVTLRFMANDVFANAAKCAQQAFKAAAAELLRRGA